MIKVLPLKTAKEVVARERERKARTTLLMALLKDHLEKFHKMADAKEIFDDLYNNLRVFESDVKGTTASSSNTHNINDDDMEEMDLKWQMAMISTRIKKFHKRTGRKLQFDTKDPVGFDKAKVECFNCHKMRHFARDCRAKGNQDNRRRDDGYDGNKARDNGRRPAYQEYSKALVTIHGKDIDWSRHVDEDVLNYAMMAYSSSNLGFANEVKSCSKTCKESYARLKKLYDEQRDKLGDASVEITAYLDDKTDVLTYHKKLLAEALKEKEDLKTKFENWQNSFKNLSRLLNTQMSANDKFRLGYGDYRYGTILSYENEVLHSVFMNKESDLEDTSVNDRFTEGMHAVPPPVIGNYMPSRPDVEIDYSKFTYVPNRLQLMNQMLRLVNILLEDPHKALKDKEIVDSGCSRHMTGNKEHLADYQEFKGGFVAFGGRYGKITGKEKIKAGRIKREYSNARTLQQNGVAERKNRTLIEAVRTMLADLFLPTTFWAE
nr:hypothetical protein [Tanacetum cinerariifolium]